MASHERLQRVLEKIDQLDAGGLARSESVVDGLLAAQGKGAKPKVALGMAAYWLGILMANGGEELVERERQSPPDQNSQPSVAPWGTNGRVIWDADGHTIAVVVREADAGLMATAPGMAANLWLQLDSGLLDPYFRESVEEALRDAGRELPVKEDTDGGN